MSGAGDLGAGRRFNPTVWLVRLATAAMLIVGIVILWRRTHADRTQDELVRYSTLTVPAYLDELARLHALLDRLRAPAVSPEQARSLLVDEVMPQLIRMRKRAEAVQVESQAVRESNAEFLAAIDRYLEMDRSSVKAIDDPSTAGEEAHRAIVSQRRAADDAVRAYVVHLKERCARAGLKLVPGDAAGR